MDFKKERNVPIGSRKNRGTATEFSQEGGRPRLGGSLPRWSHGVFNRCWKKEPRKVFCSKKRTGEHRVGGEGEEGKVRGRHY